MGVGGFERPKEIDKLMDSIYEYDHYSVYQKCIMDLFEYIEVIEEIVKNENEDE